MATKKATEVKATEEVKAVETEVKATKKAPAKKAPAKKAPAKKAAAKTEIKTEAKKAPAKKTTKKTKDVYIQFAGREFVAKDIMSQVEADWKAQGRKLTEIVELKVYVKPEEGKAYYVVNETEGGQVEL